MPINFPTGPSIGQTASSTSGTIWIYNGISWTTYYKVGQQDGDLVIAEGYQGLTGAQGTTGSTGNSGNQGFQGNQGLEGLQGFQGNQGLQGFQGAQGSQGLQGFQGNQGSQGFQGNQGLQGNTGQAGSGAPGNNDVGVMYLKNNTIPTIITTINERVVVAGTMSTGVLFNFIKDPTTNSLKYIGVGGRFHIIANFSFSGGSRDIYGFYIGRNTDDTTPLDPNADRISESEIYVNSNQINDQPAAGTIQTILDLNTDDRVFFIVQNRETTSDLTVEFLKFTVTSLTAEKGATGSQGWQGRDGEAANIGATGVQGFQGNQGSFASVGPNTIDSVWSGTLVQYNALSPTYSSTTIYFIE